MDKEKIIVEEILPDEGRAYLRSTMKQMAIDGLINKFIREGLIFKDKGEYEESDWIGFKVRKEERRDDYRQGTRFLATLIPVVYREEAVNMSKFSYCRKLTWRERFRALFKGRA